MSDPVAVLEALCADAWPPRIEQPLGDWRLRASGGWTGRANSALAVGSPGTTVGVALKTVAEFSATHGIRPYAQVVTGAEIETELTGHGWEVNAAHPRGAESVVMTSTTPAGPALGSVHDEPPPGWFSLAVGSDSPTGAQRHVLTTGPRIGYGIHHIGGRIAGVVRGCVVRDTLHVSVLTVAPDQRRQGVARGLLGALDAWAGTPSRVLQVAVDNTAALALYAGLGYEPRYRYRYWAPR